MMNDNMTAGDPTPPVIRNCPLCDTPHDSTACPTKGDDWTEKSNRGKEKLVRLKEQIDQELKDLVAFTEVKHQFECLSQIGRLRIMAQETHLVGLSHVLGERIRCWDGEEGNPF